MVHTWPRGTVIVQRDYWRGQLITIRPVTVVADSAQSLSLYSHAGAVFLSGAMQNRRALSIDERIAAYRSVEPPALHPRTGKVHVLTLNPTGAHHSVWLFWDRSWRFLTWFVNLQAPFEQVADGINVHDYLLDIRIDSSLHWEWKDRDEFEAACDARLIDRDMQLRILAEGKRMVEAIESRSPPFNEDWSSWRPEPQWPVPEPPHRSISA